jgi:hypothetical protein
MGVSPVSFLEIQFLAEAGKLEVRSSALVDGIMNDARFVVDELPLLVLIRNALSWIGHETPSIVCWWRTAFRGDRLCARSIARSAQGMARCWESETSHGEVHADSGGGPAACAL